MINSSKNVGPSQSASTPSRSDAVQRTREQLIEENRTLQALLEKERLDHAGREQQIRREATIEVRELQQTITRLREQMEAIDWDRRHALQKTASESRAEILQLQATVRELRALMESQNASNSQRP